MSSQFLFRSPLEQKIEDRPLFLWFGRLYRFCRRTLGWLINLELFFQLPDQFRQLLLSFGFDLLPQGSFHFSAFLDVPRFKLSAFLRIQMETRVANRRVGLAPDGLTAQILSLAHYVALCRAHPQPTLGVALEILPGCRGHCHPPFAHALARGTSVLRPGRLAPNGPVWLWLRLYGCAE
jgi:hypothetical protein